jgi:hypothetical protein
MWMCYWVSLWIWLNQGAYFVRCFTVIGDSDLEEAKLNWRYKWETLQKIWKPLANAVLQDWKKKSKSLNQSINNASLWGRK